MNIFKKPNSDKKNQGAEKESVTDNKKQQDTQKTDPHANGGCCGSCGGEQGKSL